MRLTRLSRGGSVKVVLMAEISASNALLLIFGKAGEAGGEGRESLVASVRIIGVNIVFVKVWWIIVLRMGLCGLVVQLSGWLGWKVQGAVSHFFQP